MRPPERTNLRDESSLFFTGAILAGGQSRRMGRLKEGIALRDGRPMIEHVVEPLREVCRWVVIVGACRAYPISPEDGLIHLTDSQPGAGPLAAIATLLRSGLDPEGYLVAACDQPYLTSPLLRRLRVAAPFFRPLEGRSDSPRFFRSERGAPIDPFPGYFPVAWLSEIEEALQRGERSIRRLIERTPVSWVSLPESLRGCLKGINRLTDLP